MKYYEPENYNLTSQELKVIIAINKDPQMFITNSIVSFAEKYDLNISAISRASKKLNYETIKEFKYQLSQKVHKYKTISDEKWYSRKEAKPLEQVYSHYRNALEFNTNIKTKHLVKKVSEDIIKAKNIYIFGWGNSYYSAKNLETSLARLNIKCMLNFGDWFLEESIMSVDRNDLIIVFTERADSKSVKMIQKASETKKIKSWIVTHNIKLKSKKLFNVLHYDFVSAMPKNISPSSKIAQLLISDFIIDNIKIEQK